MTVRTCNTRTGRPWRPTWLTVPVLALDLCMDFDLIRERDTRTGRQVRVTKQMRDKVYVRKTVMWAGAYSNLITREVV